MHNRGFQWFVVIMGALILIFGTVGAIRVRDNTTMTLLPIFGILYVLYLILFVKAEKNRKENRDKPKESPLLRK